MTIMATAKICDRCRKVLEYEPECKIKIYVHPYGDTEYELCTQRTEKLKKWLNENNPFSIK